MSQNTMGPLCCNICCAYGANAYGPIHLCDVCFAAISYHDPDFESPPQSDWSESPSDGDTYSDLDVCISCHRKPADDDIGGLQCYSCFSESN